MIPTNLIENALSLTGKKMEDMEIIYSDGFLREFSIENFCYYLLSPEFIEKYSSIYRPREKLWNDQNFERNILHWLGEFGEAIYEYQSGRSSNLISLLEKIGHTENT